VTVWRVGIYGKLKTLDTVLRDGDRVEIYRPLIADPKVTRRRRAESRDAKKSG
jgi:putative ubiquitin-RnfH superfamily antitoxin RatB of RatAB toxin-antitoxin module